jgi:hypothetical protein
MIRFGVASQRKSLANRRWRLATGFIIFIPRLQTSFALRSENKKALPFHGKAFSL